MCRRRKYRCSISRRWFLNSACPGFATRETIQPTPARVLLIRPTLALRVRRSDPAPVSSGSFLQNSTYHTISRNWSFARSVRIGILQPYGSTVSLSFPAQTGTPSPQLIPLPERLFAGGGTSLRGFALNQAGPRDALTGFPVGGQAMLILNQELRFPMKLPIIGSSLGGAFFYDGGNVYSRLDRITLRWSSPDTDFQGGIPWSGPGTVQSDDLCVQLHE